MAGGTGLVGSLVADALARRPDVELSSLVRAPTRPRDRTIDFDALVADPAGTVGPVDVDVGISCLGTTIRKAESQAAFRRVDQDYVFAVARSARDNGARQFILMSSVGAGGRAFYLRVKGEVEEAVRGLGFERLDIIRPGLLLGDRAERRVAERLAQAAMPILNPLLRGRLEQYAAVPAAAVANAIVQLVGAPGAGVHIAHTREIIGGSDLAG
ncbi:NAD(P)H-binding protein [Sphingomonas tabacisoli]|uniref:NAD(P)H-binding protein n=1 Tax=Sphingomonas tabacisoli TaxID=2249466 RepID=A0ABW4I0K4_9SPHN